ncbi:MAG: hypothetical protein ACXABI_04695 [Candidatus Hodarchaeales archaeon]|jgi:hypothetical protein
MNLNQFGLLWQKWPFKFTFQYNYYNSVTLAIDFEPHYFSLNNLEMNTIDEDG